MTGPLDPGTAAGTGQAAGIRTFLRGSTLALAGEIRGWTRLQVSLLYRRAGSWLIEGPADGPLSRMEPGMGLIVVDHRGIPIWDPDGVLISGDLDTQGPWSWSAEGGAAGGGTLQLTGGDDLQVVADELAFPVPTAPVSSQTAAAYDARSGTAEAVIKAFVAANVGAARHASRGDADVPNARTLTVATNQNRGSATSFQARWDPLMDIVRQLGSTSTPELGVRVTQSPGGPLTFEVYEAVDRSDTVVFSPRRGLRSATVQRAAPTATHVVVAGAGEGSVRAFRERRDLAAAQQWRRIIRTFVDARQTDVPAELDAAGDEELARGRRTGVMAATAIDHPRCRFGRHFTLGDWVTVLAPSGVAYVEQVTGATITVTDKGRDPTQLILGNPDGAEDTPESWAKADRALDLIGALQRRY
ncbi:Gp37-like protein [Actinomadura flavalba]|uniref:Gp37-like protein n=1 Tax=Actinomadura flavalba TaxID=1120938 RepID=UPI0003AA7D0C|nr:hypothetical protein [Actinomadura flavalba]